MLVYVLFLCRILAQHLNEWHHLPLVDVNAELGHHVLPVRHHLPTTNGNNALLLHDNALLLQNNELSSPDNALLLPYNALLLPYNAVLHLVALPYHAFK